MKRRIVLRLPSTLRIKSKLIGIAIALLTSTLAVAQTWVALQPFAQQVRQVETALAYLGEPLPPKDQEAIEALIANTEQAAAIEGLQQILDRYALATVEINPESRVKVRSGLVKPVLVEAGTRLFLVKVMNQAGVTGRLRTYSPNALPVYVQSDGSAEPAKGTSPAEVRDRWMSLDLYDKDPMSERLSGLPLEYRILEIYSRDRGQRSAEISFDVGQGTQDIGFRNQLTVLFNALPAVPMVLRVRDENGFPSVAAFTIRDRSGRLYPNPSKLCVAKTLNAEGCKGPSYVSSSYRPVITMMQASEPRL